MFTISLKELEVYEGKSWGKRELRENKRTDLKPRIRMVILYEAFASFQTAACKLRGTEKLAASQRAENIETGIRFSPG